MKNKVILEIKNLTKYYGDILGVEDLSFSLNEGEVFGFIGPNGAGKSTTLRLIMNLINKNSGSILFYNKELLRDDISLKELIGYLPSEIFLYDDLTVKEILDYHESFYKKDMKLRRRDLISKLKVDESKKIEDLSLGNLKKVGIILALMHEPKLLILDEPTSGLDPLMQQVFYDLINEERSKGTTILYSTHLLNEISKISDRVGIIKDGKLLKVEKVSELKKRNLNVVTLESTNVNEIIKDLNLDVCAEGNLIKFNTNMSADLLIKSLACYQIDRILIEEATLEDIFLLYYK